MARVELDRQGMQLLDAGECWQLLASQPVGRVGFILTGRPVILPVNHRVDGTRIVFRTAEGSKLELATRTAGAAVAYEVDRYDADEGTGWSVLAQGTLHPVLNETEVAQLDRLELRVWPDVTDRPYWLRIDVGEISGRRILPRGDRPSEE
ncbi:MAG TPA: pyridoxamine 5'-phosphate oxidase family protein [Nitriliruptorales bacterium]|nr:pyridoxamine 5'-phosphate oxidase family protein [Nitriliruptorales bacterium]